MTISIECSIEFNGSSLADIINATLINHPGPQHPPGGSNTGQFYGGGLYDGSRYAFTDASADFGLQVQGALSYSGTPTHVLHGSLDQLTLGGAINLSSGDFINTPTLRLNFTPSLNGSLPDGGSLHSSVWGLMNNAISAPGQLLDLLQSQGLTLSNPLPCSGLLGHLAEPAWWSIGQLLLTLSS